MAVLFACSTTLALYIVTLGYCMLHGLLIKSNVHNC